MSAAATTAPPIKRRWERKEIPVRMRRIECGSATDEHIPEHLHLGGPVAGNRDDVVQSVAVDVSDRHLDAAGEVRTIGLRTMSAERHSGCTRERPRPCSTLGP